MGEECKILLESESYYPGQIVNGRIECNFLSENKIRGIRVRFKGRAKVHWREGRYGNYYADETYFEMESDLLDEPVILQGQHNYPFSFNLPFLLPPSITHEYGDVKYTIQTTIYRPWSIDRKIKKAFVVHSFIDLNTMDDIKNPTEFTKIKRPFSLFKEKGPITIIVKLPATGFIPSQMVAFSACVKNDSRITVEEVQFKLVQGFEFHCKLNMKSVDAFIGQKHAIIGSSVAPGDEKSWGLELRVPPNMYNGNLSFCNLIKSYVELRVRRYLRGGIDK